MKKFISITFIAILIDQVIKICIDSYMTLAQSITLIPSFFRITYLQNTGAAWSVFSNKTIYLIIVTIIFLLAFYFLILRKTDFKKDKTIGIFYGIIIGGIIGNLIDRIRLGFVIDYLDFSILGYNFPVFNLADILIVIGCIILVIKSFKKEDIIQNNQEDNKIIEIKETKQQNKRNKKA